MGPNIIIVDFWRAIVETCVYNILFVRAFLSKTRKTQLFVSIITVVVLVVIIVVIVLRPLLLFC